MLLYGFVSTILIFVGSFPLKDPEKTKAYLFTYVKALLNRNN